jgi:hypothetical protein
MIVLVKEVNTNREPFRMKEDSANRLLQSNPGKYEIVNVDVAPIKKKVIQDAPLAETISDEQPKQKKTRKNKIKD